MQLKNNCTSNSQVIARGEAECNLLLHVQLFFNCMKISVTAYINHIAFTFHLMPKACHPFQLEASLQIALPILLYQTISMLRKPILEGSIKRFFYAVASHSS